MKQDNHHVCRYLYLRGMLYIRKNSYINNWTRNVNILTYNVSDSLTSMHRISKD